jgi:hypothetical protein
MILDNNTLLASGLAYNGTALVVDTGALLKISGQPIKIFVEGHSLAGVTALVINDGPTSSPATLRATFAVTAAQLNAGVFEFYLPSNTQRYITIGGLTGGSGGTYDAGLVLGTQTAK